MWGSSQTALKGEQPCAEKDPRADPALMIGSHGVWQLWAPLGNGKGVIIAALGKTKEQTTSKGHFAQGGRCKQK